MSGGGSRAAAALEVAVPLRAGPLRAVFDRGELRWIRLGEHELLRGIYAAVREPGWGTVPGTLEDLVIEAEQNAFRIRFTSRHRRGAVDFEWEGRLAGDRDGRVVFEMDGRARQSFRRNRIGLCVLHPVEECAGRDCVVESVDGTRRAAAFPRLVAPRQPFLEVRAVRHEVVEGVFVEVRLEGDTFETEDQRNWSDASFKTYSTPLALGFPVEVAAGARIRQTVTLRLHGHDQEAPLSSALGVLPPRRNGPEPVVVGVDRGRTVPRPRLGLCGATAVVGGAELEEVRRLGLDHVRADLRLDSGGWEEALERAASCARAAGVALEAALFLPAEPGPVLRALAARVTGDVPVASWLLFRSGDATTAEGDVALARGILGAVTPSASFGGGTDGHFADLNRRRSAAAGLDHVSFALTPQAHAFDDATLVENLSSLDSLVKTVRSFAAGTSIGLSPVTLRPRGEPRPAACSPGDAPFTDDPRQPTPFAAAWTLGLVAEAARAGIASLSLFELAGPRGVLDGAVRFPVGHALAGITDLPDAVVLAARSRRPERVQALALGSGSRTRLFLANVTRWRHPVVVEGFAGRARRFTLAGAPGGEESGLELELGPHETVRLDPEEEEDA